jgi:hypothetical protein
MLMFLQKFAKIDSKTLLSSLLRKTPIAEILRTFVVKKGRISQMTAMTGEEKLLPGMLRALPIVQMI